MGIFNKSKKIDTKLSEEPKEVKGYMDTIGNSVNAYFKSLQSLFGYREYSFTTYDRAKLTSLYRDNATVRKLVDARARLGTEVMRYAKVRDLKDSKVIDNHPLISTINKANDLEYSRDLLVERILIDHSLYGEAFVYKKKEGVTGIALYPMFAEQVQICEGKFTNPITGFEFGSFAGNNKMLPSEVMFMRNYNPSPSAGYHGLPLLVSAARILQLLESGDTHVLNALKNGGVKNLISVMPTDIGYGRTAIEEAEDSINGSSEDVRRNKIFQVPLQVSKVGDSLVDLEIINTSKYANQVLYALFDIPYSKLLGESKYANQKEDTISMYTQVGIPLAEKLCQAFSHFFRLDLEGNVLSINIDDIDALREDTKSILDGHVIAKTSTNERRKVLKLEPLKDTKYDEPIFSMGDELGSELGVNPFVE